MDAAVTAIGEGAWTPIRYPHSDTEVAEAEYTAFTSRKKSQAVTVG